MTSNRRPSGTLVRHKCGVFRGCTLLYDQDRYPEARDAFRKFTALDPQVGPGFALLGLCEFQTKDYPQALAHLNQGRRLGIESEHMNTVALYHVALLLIHFEQYESAGQIMLEFAARKDDGRYC